MHPTQPPLPGPPSTGGPATREIPLVPVGAPAGPATTPQPAMQQSAAAVAAAQPQPTGPVDYVPGLLPGGATAPAPAAAAGPSDDFLSGLLEEPRRPRDREARARIAGGVLAVLAVVLLELGLLVHDGGDRLWSRVPLWAGFATVAAVLGLAVLGARLPGGRRFAGHAWAVAAGGLAGLAVFWLLVALPSADTDRGFLLTAALACLGAAVRLTAGRGISRERVLDRSGALADGSGDTGT